MSPKDIGQILVSSMWICAFMISMIARTSISASEPNDENGAERICPKYCTCTKMHSNDSNTARCAELIGPEYSGQNIVNFALEKPGDIQLGLNDLRVPGLSHVQAIEITHPNQYDNSTQYETFPVVVHMDDTYTGTLNIHPDIFKNKTQLKTLAIHKFDTFVDNTDLTGGYLFDAPSIEGFVFSVLNYEPWSPSTFIRMSSLIKIIIMSPNFIMKSKIFAPLRGLRYLEIRGAHSWTDIGPNDFIDMETLEELWIGNNMKTIHEDAFLYLSQLKHLDISNNKISSFTEKHLRNNPKLEVVRMSYNNDLKLLPVFKLDDANSNYESIHRFECTECGLDSITDGTFDAMPSLKELDLRGNHLTTLPRGFFKQLMFLQSLDLSHNIISYIPATMFEGANKLSVLNLKGNPITTLDIEPFVLAPVLTSLNLAECRIETWNPTSAQHHSLSSLSIETNSLKNITMENLQQLSNISQLNLIYNPINCDELKDVIIWSLLRNVTTKFFSLHHTYCMPEPGETCWGGLMEIMCSKNYTSELDEIKRHRNRNLDEPPEKEEAHGSASAINQIMIALLLTVTTIIVAIINESHILYI